MQIRSGDDTIWEVWDILQRHGTHTEHNLICQWDLFEHAFRVVYCLNKPINASAGTFFLDQVNDLSEAD